MEDFGGFSPPITYVTCRDDADGEFMNILGNQFMSVGSSVPCGFFVQEFDRLNNQKRLKVWEDGKQQVQVRWEGWVCPL